MGRNLDYIEGDLYRKKPKHPNKRLKLSLPVPPSINAMYVGKRGGGKILSKKSKNYVRDARALINVAIEEQRWVMPDRHVWLYIDMVFYFPDRRVRDSHNCLKLLLDVMEGYLYENDCFVLPRIQSVEYDKDNPRVDMLITPQTDVLRAKGLKTAHIGV